MKRILHFTSVLLFLASPLRASGFGWSLEGVSQEFSMKGPEESHPNSPPKESFFLPPLPWEGLMFSLPPGRENRASLFFTKNGKLRSILLPPKSRYSFAEGTNLQDGMRLEQDQGGRLALSIEGDFKGRKEISIEIVGSQEYSISSLSGLEYTIVTGREGEEVRLPVDSSALSMSPQKGRIDSLKLSVSQIPEFPEPLLREGGQILNSPPSAWRNGDFEVYKWSLFPSTLIFDTKNYSVQGRLFRRLAFYVEKKGYVGTLMPNRDLVQRSGWNAHNYRPRDLARFFTQASEEDFTLNEEELLLLSILLNNGILRTGQRGGYIPGKGAVLSISQESYPALRQRLFAHEGAHGIYFTREGYQNFVNAQWNGLSPAEQTMWRLFLSYRGYDPDNEYLIINEYQGYLLQQPPAAAPDYFYPLMVRLGEVYPAQRGTINEALSLGRGRFQKQAAQLEGWVYERWGLRGGDFCLLGVKLSP